MITNFNKSPNIIFFIYMTIVLILIHGCTKKEDVPIQCLVEYIKSHIEEGKIKEFEKLNGIDVWGEGWGNLTAEIAEDDFVLTDCGVIQYIGQYNESIDILSTNRFCAKEEVKI